MKLRVFGLACVTGLLTLAVSGENFNQARSAAFQTVERTAAAEKKVRAEQLKKFVFGQRAGGTTFGAHETPLKIEEDPPVDKAVMDAARARIRAALPAGELSADDAFRLDEALFGLERRGGNRASRMAALERLKARGNDLRTVRSVFAAYRALNNAIDALAYADELLAGKPTEAVRKTALGAKWSFATSLGLTESAEAARDALAACPLDAETIDCGYLTYLDGIGGLPAVELLETIEADLSRLTSSDVRLTATQSNAVYGALFETACRVTRGYENPAAYEMLRKYAPYMRNRNGFVDQMMRIRCYADAEPYAKGEQKAYCLLALGRKDEALACAPTGSVLAAVCAATSPKDLAERVRALRPDGWTDAQFADFVLKGLGALAQHLDTEAGAPYLLALRGILMSLERSEEKVVYPVRYRADAPGEALGAETAGLFDTGWFSSNAVENRFAKRGTYSSTSRETFLKNLKENPPPDLVGVTGEGRSAELSAVYDDCGVHIYTRFRDPEAAKFKRAEGKGVYFEFSFMPGTETSWYQLVRRSGQTKDLYELEWDSVDFGRRHTYGNIACDSTETDSAYYFHVCIPWTFVYTRLPKDGGRWSSVLCVSLPSGGFSLGGGNVHEMGRGWQMEFEIPPERARQIRRALVRRGAGDFLRFASEWGNVKMWGDDLLGDPKFFAEVVKPWADEREAVARKLVAREPEAVDDAEYEALSAKYLEDWLDTRLVLNRLRVAWLSRKFFD